MDFVDGWRKTSRTRAGACKRRRSSSFAEMVVMSMSHGMETPGFFLWLRCIEDTSPFAPTPFLHLSTSSSAVPVVEHPVFAESIRKDLPRHPNRRATGLRSPFPVVDHSIMPAPSVVGPHANCPTLSIRPYQSPRCTSARPSVKALPGRTAGSMTQRPVDVDESICFAGQGGGQLFGVRLNDSIRRSPASTCAGRG